MYLQRVKVPFISEFPEGRGISGHILTNILKHLDDLKLYDNDRENDVIPLMLVVVHGSCFCLYFFQYICDKNHKWTVVFGVPYGKSLWKVGDSEEQNGT